MYIYRFVDKFYDYSRVRVALIDFFVRKEGFIICAMIFHVTIRINKLFLFLLSNFYYLLTYVGDWREQNLFTGFLF